MLGKVQEMLDLSASTHLTSYIFDAGQPGIIEHFLKGEKIGTAITHEQYECRS
jgi:isopentenyl phosphate kinase